MKNRTLLLALPALLSFSIPAFASDYLRIQDPKSWWRYGQGTIEKAVLSVRPVGIYMEYGLYLTFSARDLGYAHADTMEVQFQFDLPEESIVFDSWLWIGDTIIRAEIMDKWTAASIYEDIVNRRQDPSILYKRSANHYELRIFPMLGDESRKVKITYLVPTRWNSRNAFSLLPTNLIRTSKNIVTGLSVLAWPGGEWRNPKFLEYDEIPFTPGYDTTNGDHYRADLPWGTFQNSVHFAVDAPLTNGLFVNKYDDSGGGYYQLALLPSAALNLSSRRKTAILFDYTDLNSDVTTTEVISAVKSMLFTTFTTRDSFNLIFSQASIKRASEWWLPADSATVDSVFTALGPNPIASYSNLPSLMADGIGFVKDNGDTGDIMLMSNSDQFGWSTIANQLVEDLLALMTEVIPVHVIDYQTANFSWNWIGGRYYYGNEYFYINITRLTGGNYSAMRTQAPYDPFTPFSAIVPEAFQAIGGFISSFDLHTRVQNGFCHSRINLGGPVGPVYLDRPILQAGRYYGNFPMTVEVSGVYDGSVFNVDFEIGDTSAQPNDSLSQESWVGNYIRSLETQSQTNDVVNEIVNASVGERVLSVYSAFLCLEPSRGGEVCYDCLDESGSIVDVQDSTADAGADSLLQAFPNPFNASTTIRLRIPSIVDRESASLKIYDVLGREVRDFDLGATSPGGQTDIVWSGTDRDGTPVNSGVYFVVYRTAGGVQTLKLMMLK
ncbi:MAG TPA: VIT domain-containing protein [Bacteroidota bacterium]|nr:VIT domain-containing protein [Bacteroidota bacterium]